MGNVMSGSEPEPKSGPEPMRESESEPKSGSEPEPMRESESEPEPMRESESEPKSGSMRRESEPDPDSDSDGSDSTLDLGDDDLSFPLEIDPEESGGRAEIAENIYQHQASDFTIVMRQSHAVHGTWSPSSPPSSSSSGEQQPPPPLPASLLVFRLELHSQSSSQSRRFKHVSVKMLFRRQQNGSAEAPSLGAAFDPVVKSFEPAQGVVITQLPTEVSQTQESSLGANVGVNVGAAPVTATTTVHYTKKITSAWKRNARVTISGLSTKTPPTSADDDDAGRRLGDDCITWSIRENALQKEIPDSYGLAVLLQRRDHAKFRVFIEVKAVVDWRYQASTMLDTFYGRQRKSKLYNPSSSIQGQGQGQSQGQGGSCPDGVEANNLGALTDGPTLSRLSFSHLPEDFQPNEICR